MAVVGYEPQQHSRGRTTRDGLAAVRLKAGLPLACNTFQKFYSQQELRGLYDDTQRIGRRDGWNFVLEEKQVKLRGHQLVRRSG